MIGKTQREKLYTGFGLFLSEFRSYVVSFLKERAKDEWIKDFEKTLGKDQKRNWEKELRKGASPEDLIDYHHFQSFAEEHKDLLKRDFPGKNQSLPTWLLEIATVRHKLAHHNGIEEDEAQMVWIRLRTIAKFLGKDEMAEEFSQLEKAKTEEKPLPAEAEKIEVVPLAVEVETNKVNMETQASKKRLPPVQSNSSETLDIVNCANADFRQTVTAHNVYLCPARGGAYKHKQCKYIGIYWEKHVSRIAAIEAVIDVLSENTAEVYWINGNQSAESYIAKAKEKALMLRPNDLPLRVFLLEKLYPTDFVKDSSGGMFGSKVYLDVESLDAVDAEDLAQKLHDKNYSELGL